MAKHTTPTPRIRVTEHTTTDETSCSWVRINGRGRGWFLGDITEFREKLSAGAMLTLPASTIIAEEVWS